MESSISRTNGNGGLSRNRRQIIVRVQLVAQVLDECAVRAEADGDFALAQAFYTVMPAVETARRLVYGERDDLTPSP